MSKDKQEKSTLEKEIDGYLMNEIERLTAVARLVWGILK